MLLELSGTGPAPLADASDRPCSTPTQNMINSRCVAETVATDAKGRENRSQVEFDTINRIRVTSDQASFIVLPEGTWMRTGGGEWMQPPIDMSAMFKRLVPSTLEEIRAGTSNIRDEGMQTDRWRRTCARSAMT